MSFTQHNQPKIVSGSSYNLNTIIFCVICSLLGFAFNLTEFNLFGGMSLVLGPTFGVLVALSVGPVAGVIVAAVSVIGLVISWEHWYWSILFLPEAFFVGWLFKRGWNELFAIFIYWLVIAVPITVIFWALGYISIAADIIIKYLLNSVVYTLLASAFFWFFSIQQKLKIPQSVTFNLHTQIFMVSMVSMALPTTWLMFDDITDKLQTTQQKVRVQLQNQSEKISLGVQSYLKRQQFIIEKQSEILSLMSPKDRKSNRILRQFHQKNSVFISLFTANQAGEIETFSPIERLSEKSPAIDDRNYFQQSIKGHSFMSQVIRGRAKGEIPILVISEPIRNNNEILGVIAGSIDLSFFEYYINEQQEKGLFDLGGKFVYLVTDSKGNTIFASEELNLKPMQKVEWYTEPAKIEKGFSANNIIKGEFLSHTASLANGWKVNSIYLAKDYIAQARQYLYQLSFLLSGIVVIIILLAKFLSFQMSRTLIWLLERANSLNFLSPIKQKPFQFSSHIPKEISQLIDAFESAEKRIQSAFETERLHQAKRADAEKASVEKSFFVSAISHELRTPLNAILGFCQLLQNDNNLPPEENELVEEINIASQHLMLLINDILDLSRIESGKLKLKLSEVEPSGLVRECLTLFKKQAMAKNITITIKSSGKKCIALADELKLKQILINLISNALKYNKKDGSVVISLCEKSAKDKVVISVKDTGYGISQSQLNKLFKPFERLSREEKINEGFGIGLVVSKKLTEAMDGKLIVESEIDKGSTFTLKIPKSGTTAFNDKEDSHLVQTSIAPTSVLYVEDNDINALVMEKVMQRFPQIQFTRVASGTEGLERLKIESFDFVFLDITLPDIDGFEVLRRIKSELTTQYNYVFAISANALAEDIRKGLAQGFDEYITKPVRFEQLFEAIKKRQMTDKAVDKN